jgi:hypothetical protein
MSTSEFGDDFKMIETPLGRWIIVAPWDSGLAWTGSRWAPHVAGLGLEAQISNFETAAEANEYGETFL